MFKILSPVLIAVSALGFVSCSPGIDMPQGTSRGYTSARLTLRDPDSREIKSPTERQIHRLIQNSISKQFTAKGLSYGKGDADLVVAYMVIYQEPGMTASSEEFFGYGRDGLGIAGLAHTRGALANKNPDYFRQAGVVIDIIDSRTNKLVYRNYAKGNVTKGTSESTRASRVDAAVAEALAEFFR